MRRLAGLVLLSSSIACSSYSQVKLRPGSDVALPRRTSLGETLLTSAVCAKKRTEVQRASCIRYGIDSLAPGIDSIVTPPARLPK